MCLAWGGFPREPPPSSTSHRRPPPSPPRRRQRRHAATPPTPPRRHAATPPTPPAVIVSPAAAMPSPLLRLPRPAILVALLPALVLAGGGMPSAACRGGSRGEVRGPAGAALDAYLRRLGAFGF